MSTSFMPRPLAAAAVLAALLAGTQPASAAVQFEDRAEAAGVADPQETFGASWGELNGDRYPDLFVSNHRGPPQVLVNRGDGTFYDNAGQVVRWIHRRNADTHGGSWADFDDDGDQDLLVTAGTFNEMQFFVNERGDLVDRAAEYNIDEPDIGGRLPLWMDYDDDGHLDALVIQFGSHSSLWRQTPPGFTPIGAGIVCPKIHYGHLLDVNGDGRLDVVCADDANFPRNVYDTHTLPFSRLVGEFPTVHQVVDSVVADFDNNGEMDVMLINDTLLRPSGASQPRSHIVEALLAGPTKTVSFTGGNRLTVDLDWKVVQSNLGLTEIVIGADSQELVFDVPFTLDADDPNVHGIPAHDPTRTPFVRIGYDTAATPPRWTFIMDTTTADGGFSYDEMYTHITADGPLSDLRVTGLDPAELGGQPTLLLNDGSDFNDATSGSGLEQDMLCVSAVAGDFDNDMDVDLYLACRTATSNIANRYYDNDGTGHFTLVPNAGGATGPIGSYLTDGAGAADSVVVADYDVDGFLDLLVTNGFNLRPREAGGPKNLYHNLGNGHHWLELDLVGDATREAIGTVVRVTAGGITQTRVVDGGYHRWSQNHRRIHVGLGDADSASVTIVWPDGFTENHLNVTADALYTATQGAGLAPTPPGEGVPYACGAPDVDAATARGVYVWKECYLDYWRVRFAAAGGSDDFRGRVRADVPFDTVNQVGAPNLLDWQSNPGTLVFDITETAERFKGFNIRPGDGAASHCLELDVPAGVPVYYGPLEQQVASGRVQLETGEACPDAEPLITVVGANVSESAGTATFELSLSQPLSEPVRVDVTTADGTAAAGSDYTAVNRIVTFEPGEQIQTVSVSILDDGTAEGDETFTLLLSNAVGADLAATSAAGTILDDETAACGTPAYDAGSEAGIFLWQSCGSSDWNVRVTAGGGAAGYAGRLTSTSDFAAVSGFSLESGDRVDGSDSREIRYQLYSTSRWEDGFSFRAAPGAAVCFQPPEPAETAVFVGASRAAAGAPFDLATLGPCRDTGTAVLDVEGGSALEGDPSLVFTVRLSRPADAAVSFDYAISAVSATAGADFSAAAGSASISAGSTTTMVSVSLQDDDLTEGDETVRLTVSNLQNASPGVLAAEGTIRDDDGASCGDPGITGSSDTGLFIWRDCDSDGWRLRIAGGGSPWTVYRGSLAVDEDWNASAVAGVLLEDSDVIDVDGAVVHYRLGVAGSGVDGMDLTNPGASLCLGTDAPAGPVFVGPGRTPVNPPVDLISLEPCGAGQGQPRLSVTALDAGEPDQSGHFELRLSAPSAEPASVQVTARSGTATAGEDFVPATLTARFEPGQVSVPVPVTLIDDALAEGLETLALELSNPVGMISDVTSIEGIIHDDEPSPCGAPDFDPAVDPGYFLWKDCAAGTWQLRVALGSTSGGGSFDGRIRSNLPWENVSGHSVEATDTLTVNSDPAVIDFSFQVWGQWLDGVDVTVADNATACFDGAGASVYVGHDRLPLSPPFDLNTLGPCDVVPELTLSPASAGEGGILAFHASLSAPARGPVSFDYQTSDGSALAGTDYVAVSGSAAIPAGILGTVIPVTTLTDGDEEDTEGLTLGVANLSGATAATATATGTITGNAGSADPTCGEPTLDLANEAVLALWQDCASGDWWVRASAGGAGFLTYPGVVDSTTGFATHAGDSMESGDSLTETSATRLLYRLNLSPPFYDGFRFRLNPGATACLTANLPADARLVVGSGRAEPPSSFDLRTLEACPL